MLSELVPSYQSTWRCCQHMYINIHIYKHIYVYIYKCENGMKNMKMCTRRATKEGRSALHDLHIAVGSPHPQYVKMNRPFRDHEPWSMQYRLQRASGFEYYRCFVHPVFMMPKVSRRFLHFNTCINQSHTVPSAYHSLCIHPQVGLHCRLATIYRSEWLGRARHVAR